MEIWFYHLEQAGIEEVLPNLLARTLAMGSKALVCSPDAEKLVEVDDGLWKWHEDSFIPHGMSDAPRAEFQQALLTTGSNNENQAEMVFLLHGADPFLFDDVKRCILLFDGKEDAQVTSARAHWKRAKAEDFQVRYWKQSESGKWESVA